ncbi:MAG: hypothetical protein CFE38_21055 [Comamonadaceae bacterium PBBC1]|nr:MAG: hypothetical protein CFE38_21055 [Comamonadaceae bacterium PBBC1]
MRWVAIFQDDPGMLGVRKRHGQAHLNYLAENENEILIGGGLRSGPGEPFAGGLWVLEVVSRDRAVKLIENDPYYAPEVRSYRLFTWAKALEDKIVQL